jgi:hypothetical protein
MTGRCTSLLHWKESTSKQLGHDAPVVMADVPDHERFGYGQRTGTWKNSSRFSSCTSVKRGASLRVTVPQAGTASLKKNATSADDRWECHAPEKFADAQTEATSRENVFGTVGR